MLFGFSSSLPSNLKDKVDPVYNADDYYFELPNKLQRCHSYARTNLISAKHRSKMYYDRHIHKRKTFSNTDTVYVKKEDRKGKLDEIWSGPFKVVHGTEVNTTIKKGRKEVVVHKNRLKLCVT